MLHLAVAKVLHVATILGDLNFNTNYIRGNINSEYMGCARNVHLSVKNYERAMFFTARKILIIWIEVDSCNIVILLYL